MASKMPWEMGSSEEVLHAATPPTEGKNPWEYKSVEEVQKNAEPISKTDPNLTGATLDSMAGGDSTNTIASDKAKIADQAKYWDNREPNLKDKLFNWAKNNGLPAERMIIEDHNVGNVLRSIVNGITMNGANWLRSKFHGTTMEQEQQASRESAAQAGLPGTIGNIGGQVLTTAGGMKAAPALFGVAKGMGSVAKTAMGALSGGAIGGTNAALGGEDVPAGAAMGALGGALLTKTGGEGGAGVARAFDSFESPTSKELNSLGQKLIQTWDDSKLFIRAQKANAAFNEVKDAAVNASGYDPRTMDDVGKVLGTLQRSMTKNPMTLKQVDLDLNVIKDAINKDGISDTERGILINMKNTLDDTMLKKITDADVLSTAPGDNLDVVKAGIRDARKIFTARNKQEILERAVRNADASSMPFDQSIKSEYAKIMKSPDFETRWTGPEKEAIREIVNKGSITGMLISMTRLNKYALGGLPVAGYALGAATGIGPALAGAAGTGIALNQGIIQPSIARAAAGDLSALVGRGAARPGLEAGRTLGQALGMTGAPEAIKNTLDMEPMRRPSNRNK